MKILYLFIFTIFLCISQALFSSDWDWGGNETENLTERDNHNQSFGETLVNFYRKNTDSALRGRCHLSPTCSTFALESFRKNSFIYGLILTFDRLYISEPAMAASSALFYRCINQNNRMTCYDPDDLYNIFTPAPLCRYRASSDTLYCSDN